ncbi:DUF461 domain-containing protein [Kitasatospora sp. NPDC057015]|uniref:DUF461 domain-containing protein n=1 Tax=Kitasatospora sp. NPDC057015 TaxID=3346001 RepID=UPI00364188C7
MSRSLRRGSLAAIAAIAIASLSACAAGNNAETLEVKPDSAAVDLGDNLTLNNVVVVTGVESSGEHTGPANVTVNISNTGSAPAKLQNVTVAGTTANLSDATGASVKELVIAPGAAVLLGGPGQPSAQVSSVTVQVGGFVPATFAFEGAGTAETQASVNPDLGYYKGFGPSAAPSASASPSATASPSASGSPTASPAASATAAAGAKPTGSTSPNPSGSPIAAAH